MSGSVATLRPRGHRRLERKYPLEPPQEEEEDEEEEEECSQECDFEQQVRK